MTNEWISVYPEGYDLKTPERKELYKFILSRLKDDFGDAPKKFTQALKILFFEGKVETYSSSIADKKELIGRRPNDLGWCPSVFICLASPVVSLEFYKSVLKHYEEKSFEGGVYGVFGRRGGVSMTGTTIWFCGFRFCCNRWMKQSLKREVCLSMDAFL